MTSLPQTVYGYTVGPQLRSGKQTYEVSQGGTAYIMKLKSSHLEMTENLVILLKSLEASRREQNRASKFIVQWIASSENLHYADNTCLVFERCTHSFEQVQSNLPGDFTNKFKAITEVSLGLAHLHEHGIIHGNLKPSNILLCRVGREWLVKISDFQVCNIVKSGDSFVCDVKRPESWYRAPETWPIYGPQVCYRNTADTYSLGCFAYQLYKGTSYVNDDTGSVHMPPDWNRLSEKDLSTLLRTKKVELESIDSGVDWTRDDGTCYLPPTCGQGLELVRVISEGDTGQLNQLVRELGRPTDVQNWTVQQKVGFVVTQLIRNMLRADPFVRPNCHELLLFVSKLKDVERLVTTAYPEMRPTSAQSSVFSIAQINTPQNLLPVGEDAIATWKRMTKGEDGEIRFHYFHIFDGSCLDFSLTRRKRQDPMQEHVMDVHAQDATALSFHHNTPADDLRVWAKFSNTPESNTKVLVKLTLYLQCIPESQEDGNVTNRREICKEATRVLQLDAQKPKNVLIYFHPKSVKLLANDDEANLPRLTVSAKVIN